MLGITTFIASQGFIRDLGFLLPLMQLDNLNMSLPRNENQITFSPNDLLQTSSAPDGRIGLTLPNTVPPSFRTCNIARSYQMVFQLGVAAHPSQRPDMIQLTADVQIVSGFKPPPELLSTAQILQPLSPWPASTLAAGAGRPAGAAKAAAASSLAGELPTYQEAVAEGLASASGTEGGPELGRGHFGVDAQHLQWAQRWDDEKSP
jgi:hypothetical protein